MKKKQLAFITASVLALSTVAIIFFKKRKVRTMLTEVADEGYELAQDILYPLKTKRDKRGGYSPAY